MRVTFILKNLTEQYHKQLAEMADLDRFHKLSKQAHGDLKHCISMKIGSSDAFRDRVKLNALIKRGALVREYSLAPRRGYKLAVFEF